MFDLESALRYLVESEGSDLHLKVPSPPGLARFRVNAFHQRDSVSLVRRAIPHVIRTVDQLGLPPVIGELADEERGIILVTGTRARASRRRWRR